MTFRYPFAITAAILFAGTSTAHHSVLHYDGKTEMQISGVVTKARFGFPHSVYRIDVTGDDGSVVQRQPGLVFRYESAVEIRRAFAHRFSSRPFR